MAPRVAMSMSNVLVVAMGIGALAFAVVALLGVGTAGVSAEQARAQLRRAVEGNAAAAAAAVNITVKETLFQIYATGAPAQQSKLFVIGTGFTRDMRPVFDPPIAKEAVDIELTVTTYGGESDDDDGDSSEAKAGPVPSAEFAITLKRGHERWSPENIKYPHTTLKLVKLVSASDPKHVLYTAPNGGVQVAWILPPPVVDKFGGRGGPGGVSPLTQHAASLSITGDNFNPRMTVLQFEPELAPGIDYTAVVERQKITLTLLKGHAWMAVVPGKLNLVKVDTGAGPIVVGNNGPEGVYVAKVVPDAPGTEAGDQAAAAGGKDTTTTTTTTTTGSATVVAQASPPRIYSSATEELRIVGANFPTSGQGVVVQFRGAPNGAPQQDRDFSVSVKSSTELVLTLKRGSKWVPESSDAAFPVDLIVTSVVNAPLPEPVTVATVLETPRVTSPSPLPLLYASATRTVLVTGNGFRPSATKVALAKSSATLVQAKDFDVVVTSPTSLELTLLSSTASWGLGPLVIERIDTGAGFVPLQKGRGTRVATIEADFEGKLQVAPSAMMPRVYENMNTGLRAVVLNVTEIPNEATKSDVSVILGPAESVVDSSNLIVSFDVASGAKYGMAGQLSIRLKSDDLVWSKSEGYVTLTSVQIGDKTYQLGEGDGRGPQIARVLPKPQVTANANLKVYRTQSASIEVHGSGFSFHKQLVRLSLPLTEGDDYQVWVKEKDLFSIDLVVGRSWGSSTGPIRITGLDTGGGMVDMDVTIGTLVKDDPALLCSNTCSMAQDSWCDDEGDGALCEWGTDCADCGPRQPKSGKRGGDDGENNDDAADDKETKHKHKVHKSDDSCGELYVNNGVCEDGRPGSWFSFW